MAESPSALTPIRLGEVGLGKALPWPVYDAQGKLLLQLGSVIVSQTQLEGVIANGFFVDTRWKHDSAWAVPSVVRKTVVRAAAPHPDDIVTTAPAAKEVGVRMEDVRWHIGETLFLQVSENPKMRYAVPLIGFVKNKTIFVGAPAVDDKLEFVREGQSFVVRAFAGKKAYAFSAVAVKSVLTPYPYLHLSYPKRVSCTVVRQDSRAPVQLIASMSLEEPERVAAATLVDLSVSGCSTLLKQTLGAPGESGRAKFKVRAAGTDEILNLKVILRSVMPVSEAAGEFRHGFEFAALSARERLILSAFVHQTLADLG